MSRYLFWLTLCVVSACYGQDEDVEEEESCQLRVASCKGADLKIEKGREINNDYLMIILLSEYSQFLIPSCKPDQDVYSHRIVYYIYDCRGRRWQHYPLLGKSGQSLLTSCFQRCQKTTSEFTFTSSL